MLFIYGGCDATGSNNEDSVGSFIGLRWNGVQEEIVSIDDVTGETTTLASVDLTWVRNNNFVLEPDGNRAFLLGRKESDPDTLSRLYTIDLKDGTVSEIQISEPERGSIKFRVSTGDHLIGYRIIFQSHLEIIEIDPATGVIDVSARVDVHGVVNNGFEIDLPENKVYVVGRKVLGDEDTYIYTVELGSGRVSEVLLDDRGKVPHIFGVKDGQLLGSRVREESDGRYNELLTEIVEVDPQTGTAQVRALYEFNGGYNLATGLTRDQENMYTLGRVTTESAVRLYIAELNEGFYRSTIVDDIGVGGFYVVSKE